MFIKEKNIKNLEFFTPTKWQTVLLRNYGLVPLKNLAKTLKCSQKTLQKEAKRLGIDFIKYNKDWLGKSYITIIRNNWMLLPYNQILLLLNKDESWLDNELKNNDFLWVKLGKFKPFCEEVYFSSLSRNDKLRTNRIRRLILKNKEDAYKEPYDFQTIKLEGQESDNLCISYPYSLNCGDPFLKNNELISKEEFKTMKSLGINGIWIHGLLNDLCFNPFRKNQDTKYKIRRKNLKKFIERANKEGVKIYLYLNEPRALNIDEIKDEYSRLIGRKNDHEAALCFSFKEVQDYLYNSIKELLSVVNNISGFITITSSENLTHCKHLPGSDCPHCTNIPAYKTAALINNIIQKAIDDSKVNAILLANLWGWAPYCGFNDDDVKKGISLLNKKIYVLCVSEFGTHRNKGKEYQIGEYSISHGEPCLETVKNLKYAKKKGHKIAAKIQVNNSWECSNIPYIPAFELLLNHAKKLNKLGVSDFMMSWTLGGYAGLNASLFSNFNNGVSYDEWLSNTFKEGALSVKTAAHYFSNAFKFFPFDVSLIYNGPVQIGPLNLFYEDKTNLQATMVTFPFDDISSWKTSYNDEEFIKSFSRMNKIWKKGLSILEKNTCKTPIFLEFMNISKAFNYIMESSLNQYLYVLSRNNNKDTKKYLIKELKLTKGLYACAAKDSKIGFEASNHYSITQNGFIEKLINLNNLLGKI